MKINNPIDAEASFEENIIIYWIYLKKLLRYIFSRSFKIKSFPSYFGNNSNIQNAKKLQFGKNFKIGDDVNIECYVKKFIIFGNNCTLKNGVKISGMGVVSDFGESLAIGDDVGISDNVLIYVRAPIKIGSKTIIGPGVKIISENHIFSSINVPIKEQGVSRKGIIIGKDVWIGANAIILDGVTIGDGTVVAAGSVVNRSLESNVVAGGVPVKVLKKRNGE